MSEGKLFISCGCEYLGDMDDLDKLARTWVEEVCTRDPEEPFVMAEIYGHYCDKCWKRMQEKPDDKA